ncbi:LOW QUALITY PROTEIN: abscission/NoCut checkpoint regulator-like [Pollicipes pollicipes]|uniref:LOW QUALITY PROTEIN: abscission/NoCut checkpoint regulator-like n=1 Tax=Pollicipes pollicipes TaxID=41117 RepID=UPI001884DAD6|nr:LOW QUALITY PROTEIN: abscission/NoCut checkpoint regulator-like [Pollicipes pollicipes]
MPAARVSDLPLVVLFMPPHECPICRLSFCSRCLPEKLPVPVLGGKKLAVCRKCYNNATTIEDEAPPLLPPAALERRLEELENPARPPITVYRESSRAASLKQGLSRQDSELVDRLEALKADRKAKHVPTEREMEERLSALKGEAGGAGPSQASNLPPEEHRSAAEQEAALLAQTRGELAIAGRYRPEEGLHERLARLRGLSTDEPAERDQPPELPPSTDGQTADELMTVVSRELNTEVERADRLAQKVADIHHRLEEVKGAAHGPGRGASPPPPTPPDTADPSEEEEVQRLIQQIQERAKLEEKEMEEELESISSVDDEELPWCCICNADATVRCGGCSGDLYCRACFREGHNAELRDHEHEPFPAPK